MIVFQKMVSKYAGIAVGFLVVAWLLPQSLFSDCVRAARPYVNEESGRETDMADNGMPENGMAKNGTAEKDAAENNIKGNKVTESGVEGNHMKAGGMAEAESSMNEEDWRGIFRMEDDNYKIVWKFLQKD